MSNLLQDFIIEIVELKYQIIFLWFLYILFLEIKNIYNFFKSKDKKILLSLLKRFYYLIGWIIIFFFATSLTSYIFDIFISNSNVLKQFWNTNLNFGLLQSKHTFITSVIFFITSSYCLILSAWWRFMVNLSKVFIAIWILYPIFFTILILSTKS